MENFLSISHPSCFSPAAASNLTSFHDESGVSGHFTPCHICLHYFLPFSSSVLFSHSLLSFYPFVFFLRFLLPFVLSFRSLSFILLSSIPLFHLPFPSRLSFCLRRPSVCKAAPRFKALKNMPLNRSADYRLRVQTLFSAIYPLCLFSAPPRIILKTRAIPDSLSYRLQEEAISL